MLKIGVVLVHRTGDDYLYGNRSEVYDLETGRILPVSNMEICVSTGSVITARVTLDIARIDIKEVC